MAGEILLSMSPHEIPAMWDNAVQLGQSGLSHTKTAVAGAGAAAVAATGLAARRRHSGNEDSKNKRIQHVPYRQIGLRARNGRYCKVVKAIIGDELVEQKKFYGLMKPGLRFVPHPLGKYELLSTLTQPHAIAGRFMSKDQRQYDMRATIGWGHVLGVDDHNRKIPYFLSDGREIAAEELVLNGITAASGQHSVGELVVGAIGELLRGHLSAMDDPETSKGSDLFTAIHNESLDYLYSLGSELRSLRLDEVTPTNLDHYSRIGKVALPGPALFDQAGVDTQPSLRAVEGGAGA